MPRERFGGGRKTQNEIANILDITQSRVSQIIYGFIDINKAERLKKQVTCKINISVLEMCLNGKTQNEIAKLLDITQGRVSQIVSGFMGISTDELLKKQLSFKINISVLVDHLNGKPQNEIANILDITQGRVSQIIYVFMNISKDEMLKKQVTCKTNILVLREWHSGKLHLEIANICNVSRSKVMQNVSDLPSKIIAQVSV